MLMITLKTTWFLTLFSTQNAMLTPSLVLAYWMRGSIAGLSYVIWRGAAALGQDSIRQGPNREREIAAGYPVVMTPRVLFAPGVKRDLAPRVPRL